MRSLARFGSQAVDEFNKLDISEAIIGPLKFNQYAAPTFLATSISSGRNFLHNDPDGPMIHPNAVAYGTPNVLRQKSRRYELTCVRLFSQWMARKISTTNPSLETANLQSR